jgi:hypothetical protein
LQLQFDQGPDPLSQLRTPAMRTRIQALAHSLGEDWPAVEARLAQTAQQTGQPIDQILSAAEHTNQGAAELERRSQAQTGAVPSASQAVSQWAQQRTQVLAPIAQRIHQANVPFVQAGQQIADVTRPIRKPIAEAVGAVARTQPGQAIGRTISGVTRPFMTLGHKITQADAQGTKAIENLITGGEGYEARFMQQGADPQGAAVLGALFRGTLDPANVVGAPGTGALTAKVIGAGVDLAKVGGTTLRIPQAVGRAGVLLSNGRYTASSARALGEVIGNAREAGTLLIDKYHGTPPELREAVNTRISDLQTAAGRATQLQADLLNEADTPGDLLKIRMLLTSERPLSSLPAKLQAAYVRYKAARDATTDAAVTHGVLEEGIDNYVRRYYGSDALAKIRKGAFEKPGAGATRGGGPTMWEREYQAEQMAPETTREAERMVTQQALPTRGMGGMRARFQKMRVFDTDGAAQAAGLDDIVWNPAIALPAHDLEVSHQIANKNFYTKIANLGGDWVVDADTLKTMNVKGYVPMNNIVERSVAEKNGWDKLYLHPRVATVVRDSVNRGHDTVTGVMKYVNLLGSLQNPLKRIIFMTPAVHGANEGRAIGISEGLNVFNPRHWDQMGKMVQDAYEHGPVTQERLAAGGSIGSGSIGQHIMDTYDAIFRAEPARSAVGTSLPAQIRAAWGRSATNRDIALAAEEGWFSKFGTLGKKFSTLSARVRAFNDEVLWHVGDPAGRNTAYVHARDQMIRGGMGAPEAQRAAARYADLVMNDYNTANYGDAEKVLSSMFFVYPWMRGRARFFAALGRSFLPSTAHPAEQALYRAMATRWGMMNVVMPHIYRAWIDKASAGLEAAQIPAGYRTDKYGRQVPIYIKPTGWYNDVTEMLGSRYYMARMNPAIKIIGDLISTVNDAYRTHQNPVKAFLSRVAPHIQDVYPAGLSQLVRPGMPLWTRPLPTLGIPVTSAPPSENPQDQFVQILESGDPYAAGAFARQNGIGLFNAISDYKLTGADRKEFERGYNASSSLPGLPALPRMPKL